MGDNDLEILEAEGYYGKAGENFSHGQLIMISMKKSIDAGCKEMKEGYYNTKSDKFGNVNYIYVPDTRKEFIETIETLQMIMADDLDDDKGKSAKKEIKDINKNLGDSYKDFCDAEKKDWENIHSLIKQKLLSEGIYFREGMLNSEFPYAVEYLMERVKASRKIFAALKKLTKAFDYYREEMYEA